MKYLIFLFFINFGVSAQVKGVITDTSGNPIPYVSIFVENQNKTATSEENGPKMDAKFFPYLPKYKSTKWIKKIKLFTDSPIEGASIKLHLFSVDANGYPGEELLTQDLIVFVKKGVFRHQFDIYDMNIEIPENGIFVAFEKMRIEKNKVEKTVINTQTGIAQTEITFAPKVMCYSVKKPFSFTYTGGKWHKNSSEDAEGEPFSFYEPSLTLLLSN